MPLSTSETADKPGAHPQAAYEAVRKASAIAPRSTADVAEALADQAWVLTRHLSGRRSCGAANAAPQPAGLTIRAIAAELDLGDETVRGYLLGAYRKLGVRTRAQAVAAHLARRSQERTR